MKFSEFRAGGPPKDGIASIDKPAFLPVAQEKQIKSTEPVLSVRIGQEARAYPLRILLWHEIVNDIIDGKPIAVTYCPLCNSGVAFERVVKGKPTTFGTSGLLRNSDLVMYDRQTHSWWQQFTGRAIVGEMAGSRLKKVPARLESYGEFSARHTSGKVLQAPKSGGRPYGYSPYQKYDTSKKPFLFSGVLPHGIAPLARVVVIERAGKVPLAITLAHLRTKKEIVIDEYRIRWSPGQNSAMDTMEIAKGRDVGTVTVQKRTATKGWVDTVYDVAFAFAVHAFHKNLSIVGK